ncbi:6,7-dimethyl-8-ribityllumazine synthase [bacterium]|nr:6,7-dimethyl-8-ribityllumazine synthase [bacterium]
MGYSILEGHLSAENLKITIVVSRFNDFISNRLLEGAADTFIRLKGIEKNLTVVKVPGAFEIPLTCQRIAATGKCDGILTLGAIIRGSTPHFDYVANEVSKGVATVSLKADVPIVFGVLTTDSIEQAIERAGTKSGNKGSDTMLSLIEVIDLYKKL